MSLIFISVVSWLLGLVILLLPFLVLQTGASAEHPHGATPALLVSSVLIFALFNTPVLFCLTQGGRVGTSAKLSKAASALVINAPIFLIATFLAGRTLAYTEAFLFIGTLIVIGIAFGLGFVWSCQQKAV